jgi:TonB family protein
MLSILSGMGFTLALLIGFAQFQKPKLVDQKVEMEDLKEAIFTFTLPPPPPPPPPEESEAVPLPPNFVQFDVSPSDSPIKIAASPPNLEAISVEVMTAARIDVSSIAQLNFVPGSFKPSLNTALADVRHIWDKADVDQPPVAVYRQTPDVSASMIRNIQNPRVVLMFVVNVDGSIENIRILRSVDPSFDALVVAALQEWRFRPAVKKGKIVRCWVTQPFVFKLSGTSHFQVD